MARKIKQGSSIYSFLEKEGVLKYGSPEEIERYKKLYWANIRKEWRKAKMKECKSYTVFLAPNELKRISQAIKNRKQSITSYIKQAALSNSNNKPVIDKITIGQLREAVVLHYNTIERLQEDNEISKAVAFRLSEEARIIESKMLELLRLL